MMMTGGVTATHFRDVGKMRSAGADPAVATNGSLLLVVGLVMLRCTGKT